MFTYTTLKTAILDWTEDDGVEFQNVLDTLIGLAELRIARDADLDAFRKYATSNTTSGDRFLSKPTDIVVDRWFNITVAGDKAPLLRRDTSFTADYWPDPTATGTPRYYSDYDHDTFVLVPTPSAAFACELAYTRRPEGLSTTTSTTWLGDNAGDILLYACLMEAYLFLKAEAPVLQVWEGKYKQALESLTREEEARNRRTEYRYGEKRGNL